MPALRRALPPIPRNAVTIDRVHPNGFAFRTARVVGHGKTRREPFEQARSWRHTSALSPPGRLPQRVRAADRGDGSVVPALHGCEVGARFDARVFVLARCELPEHEHSAQEDTRLDHPTPLDELLVRLGACFQEDLEDALPPGLDLGISTTLPNIQSRSLRLGTTRHRVARGGSCVAA